MQKWDAMFYLLAEHPEMKQFLNESVRTYLHQIALTLTVLKNQDKNTLKPLPKFYGYPMDSHKEIETCRQASQMDQLHTAYYNCNSSVKPRMPVSKELTAWLNEKINLYKNYPL